MDYKFYAKVGNKYLKNKKLVSKGRDEFECREEPTQIINQMKKDGKIDKKAKVKIQKIKEACMENTYGYHLSPFSFSEPKINYKAGFGTSFYGCGFYITLDEDVVDTMKNEAQDMFAEYFIYTIKVDENANIVDEGDEDGLTLYADLVEQFNGDEVKASAEMVKRGVDGILYYSEEDGHSIVFYNPKMAKIVKTEYHQGWGERSELNENAYDDAYKRKVNNMVSKKDKWNLKMDIESLKKELVDLQNTASQLPDEYVREVCDFDSYPFDDEIDDDQNLNSWCTEVDNFLDDSLNIYRSSSMKRRFNEEIQKIDVIEKANYQELVDSVYAAARSGITNIRVRVRDDEYLDLLGDVPTREFKENKLREGSEEYQYQILKKSEIKKLDSLKEEVKETSESMGKDDVWVEWYNYAMEIGKKYLGDNVRYDTGDENYFYDSYENKMEIDPYQTWSSQSIDKMIAVRLACFKE